MKSLLIPLAAALIAAGAGTACTAEQDAVWSTAVATNPSDGHRLIYRYRSEFGPSFQRAQYPDRVTIAWKYQSTQGMPSREEVAAMDRLEDVLEPQVVDTGLAVLTLVTTGEGLREFVYYTKSQDAFMARMNEALRNMPRFPVEIDLWKDPKWERYESFRRGLKK